MEAVEGGDGRCVVSGWMCVHTLRNGDMFGLVRWKRWARVTWENDDSLVQVNIVALVARLSAVLRVPAVDLELTLK